MDKYRLRKNLIFTLVNPMVDIIKEVPSSFLNKYNLRPNSASTYSGDQKGLVEELEKLDPYHQIGGSPLNTARVIQRILKVPEVVTVFGAVGYDDNGKLLEENLTREYVGFIFRHVEGFPTARCIVLITERVRSLCTDLGASRKLDVQDLTASWEVLVEAQYYYVSAFFFGVSEEIVHRLAEYTLKTDKIFVLNIGATFLTVKYTDQFKRVLEFVDIIFGNDVETIALAKSLLDEDDFSLKDSILALKSWKQSKNRERIVVVTRGPESILVSSQRDSIEEFVVPNVENIKDTNAAGDAFVGGFLSQYVQGKNIEICVDCGIWAAAKVVQTVGCSFNCNMDYEKERNWR